MMSFQKVKTFCYNQAVEIGSVLTRYLCPIFRWIKENTELVTAAATVVMAAFTVSLWVTSHSQWQIMREQMTDIETPYVIAGTKDGEMGKFVDKGIGDKEGVLLYFHNGGQGPALNFNVQLNNFEGPTTESHMARLADDSGQVVMQVAGGISVPAGSDRQAFFGEWVPRDSVLKAKKGNAQFTLSGLFEYCDQFGAYTCDYFLTRYDASLDALSLVITGECQYRYPSMDPFLPRKLHYVLPCEQPAEREHKKEIQQDRMIRYMPGPVAAWTPAPSATPKP